MQANLLKIQLTGKQNRKGISWSLYIIFEVIARTSYQGGIHSCRFVDNHGGYVSYGGKEYKVDKFEYHFGIVKWVKCKNHEITAGEIPAGQEADGRMLYVGRAEYDGCLITGKVGNIFLKVFAFPIMERKLNFRNIHVFDIV